MKVLIVEDNPVNAEMIRHTLEKERYEPIVATDGADALAQLAAHPDVDLVITDVMMPSMDGLEMLEQIRQRPEYKTLPVVVATSLANQATVRQAVALHCKHFIVKPFTVHLLLQTVRDAIGQRGAVLQDKTRVLGRIGIDAHGYDRLAGAFATFVHERIAALGERCEREQHVALDVAARRDLFALEESAALLGAERLGNLLTALGLPGGDLATEAMGATYKALLIELRLLENALPPPPKKLGDDEPASSGTAPAT